MSTLGVIVIVAVVVFLGSLLGRYLYCKKKNLPTGECACCQSKGKKIIKKYHKKFSQGKN